MLPSLSSDVLHLWCKVPCLRAYFGTLMSKTSMYATFWWATYCNGICKLMWLLCTLWALDFLLNIMQILNMPLNQVVCVLWCIDTHFEIYALIWCVMCDHTLIFVASVFFNLAMSEHYYICFLMCLMCSCIHVNLILYETFIVSAMIWCTLLPFFWYHSTRHCHAYNDCDILIALQILHMYVNNGMCHLILSILWNESTTRLTHILPKTFYAIFGFAMLMYIQTCCSKLYEWFSATWTLLTLCIFGWCVSDKFNRVSSLVVTHCLFVLT